LRRQLPRRVNLNWEHDEQSIEQMKCCYQGWR
jgi:hypothetical protein